MRQGRWLIAHAQHGDLAALVELERLCSPHPWTEALFAAALGDRAGERVLVARAPLDEPALCGFCAFRAAADEVEIHNVAVHPAVHRRGLAQRLVHCALRLAEHGGARVAHLEVRESNAAAIALYARLGFSPAGRRRDYYESPREDALLFSRRLSWR